MIVIFKYVQVSHHTLNVSLHYFVRYLCSKYRHAQGVSEANCQDLATQTLFKKCLEKYHYLIHKQKDVYIGHIKNSMTDCIHNCGNKEKDGGTSSAVVQSLMASVS